MYALYVSFQTFLYSPPNPYQLDIKLAEDGAPAIVASRFLVQSKDLRDANDEKVFVQEIRAVCEQSKFNVTVFHPYFIYFDQVRI